MRKAGDNRLRASRADGEPNSLTQFLAAQVEALEGACNGALQVVARRTRAGRWCMAIKGISGVLTAGLLATLDVTHAPTASSFWRFAGLDPTWEWLGKDRAAKLYAELREVTPGARNARDVLEPAARRVHVKPEGLLARVERQTRPRTAREPVRSLEDVQAALTRTQLVNALATRPWNAGLKTLSWKLFDCLVKVQNRDDAPYYCNIYQNRKRREWERNFGGEYHEQCTAAMSRNLTVLQRPWYSGQYQPEDLRPQWSSGANPSTWKLPEPAEGGVPMLPPGRIELRARRVGVKQFLADLHYAMHEETFGKPPTPGAEQQARGKTSFRPPRCIQHKRHNWHKPPNGIRVTRMTRKSKRWHGVGNPFDTATYGTAEHYVELCIATYAHDTDYRARCRRELAGFDLACFCKPGTPCHADVLLRWANTP